jgi:hypothetical protein
MDENKIDDLNMIIDSFLEEGGNDNGEFVSWVKTLSWRDKNIVAAMFFISPEEILIGEDFVIDKRSAVNRNIKARVISIRPKWEKWKASFVLSVDNDTITKETIVTIIEYAGQYVGIGSFRPTSNGYFGRYKLNSIEKID